MKAEQILSLAPRVLSQEQREFYFENGYLLLESFVSREWLDRIWEASNTFLERSRGLSESDTMLALDPRHSAEHPRLRRLIDPTEHHPLYWEYVSQGPPKICWDPRSSFITPSSTSSGRRGARRSSGIRTFSFIPTPTTASSRSGCT